MIQPSISASAVFGLGIGSIVHPSEHWVIDSSPILFDGVNEILDNSIIFHLAFPLCQVRIHVIPGHEIVLVIYAIFF